MGGSISKALSGLLVLELAMRPDVTAKRRSRRTREFIEIGSKNPYELIVKKENMTKSSKK